MPHADERFSTMLSRYLGRHGDAPGDDVSSAVGRVWRRLEPHALHLPAPLPRRATSKHAWRVTAAVIAAAAVFVLAATPLIREWTSTNPARAVVDSADGSVYRTANGEPTKIPVGGSINTGETIRTNGNAGAVLALADGSRVEMRTQSELSLERADDGIRIRLRSGSIIVNAAKQRAGHLYVQTKDMAVSVVGTIFLVNAENAGSSVAVIEG
jgi:ferric-dicitrate binding protein FerR (iron transport regulator)